MPASLPTVILAGVLALALALSLTPLVMRAALRYGIVDKPKPPRKVQREPVPYLGGMVVFIAFLSSLALPFPFDARVLAILVASSLVVSVGLIDDLGTLVPKDKLIGQIVAAVVLVKAGVAVNLEAMPSPVDEIVSVLWLVTCMNAFNILDVSDGLAVNAGLVGSLGALAVAILNGPATSSRGAACSDPRTPLRPAEARHVIIPCRGAARVRPGAAARRVCSRWAASSPVIAAVVSTSPWLTQTFPSTRASSSLAVASSGAPSCITWPTWAGAMSCCLSERA